MNIQKLLILSDFSEVSTPLLSYGLALAQHLNVQVWVQHTYYFPPNVTGEVFISADTLEKYEKNIYEEFEAFKEKLPGLQERNVLLQVNYGELVPEMNKLIDQENMDLVVVSNQGGGFWTNILGSNTVKVIQHAHCPVLAVPEEAVFHPFRRIALAVDLQETKPAVISRIIAFAQAFQAKVDMVHVGEAPVPEDGRQLMHSLDMALNDVSHEFYHVLSVDVEKGLEQHVERHNNDLLVLLPRAHTFFDHLFQKSITKQVAYQKKIPLLTIHE